MIRPLAAALFAVAILPAAQASGAVPRETVAYGDLDLSTDAGRSELKARLAVASGKVCSPILTPPDSEQTAQEHMSVYQACIGRHINRAMAEINTKRN